MFLDEIDQKSLDPDTYVTREKVQEAVETLKKVVEVKNDSERQQSNQKKQLFEENEAKNFVYLQFNLKKIPKNFSTFIHHIPLPYHWRHGTNYETCLIVPDLEKNEKRIEREQELQQTRDFYRNLLEQAGIGNELINDILPMHQLTTEFRSPSDRQKLSAQYDVFLCDRKLMRNKQSPLSRFLGKAFWIDNKKVPILIDLTGENLLKQIEEKLDQTSLYDSGKGSTLTVRVGSLQVHQDLKQLTENILTVLSKIQQLYGNNVRDIGIKTEKSMTILFYADFGSANEITLEKRSRNGGNFVEEEFDFLPKANVRVFPDGKIRITKRKNEDEDNDDGNDPESLNIIRNINRAPDDEKWTRRMVFTKQKRRRRAKLSSTTTDKDELPIQADDN